MPYQRHIFQQFNEELNWRWPPSLDRNAHMQVECISQSALSPTHLSLQKEAKKKKRGLRFRETAVRLHTAFWGQFKAVRASAWQLQFKAARASAWQLHLGFDLFDQ